MTSGNHLIREYFFAGYTYNELVLYELILYCRHGITISLRQLHRILRSLGLGRRNQVTDDNEVMQAVLEEIQSSGSSLGYRSMTRRLLTRHGIVTSRSRVSNIQRQLDPNGVSSRQNHRFSRRLYVNKGPNYLIHIDGYDKLKRFGFPVHGAICGNCARFCFMKLLQEELDTVRTEWNQHHIRKNNRSESPSGKPDIMYYLPNLYGTVDYKIDVEDRDIEDVNIFCNGRDPPQARIPQDVSAILERVMRERRLRHPSTFQEALVLYGTLSQHLDEF